MKSEMEYGFYIVVAVVGNEVDIVFVRVGYIFWCSIDRVGLGNGRRCSGGGCDGTCWSFEGGTGELGLRLGVILER